MVKMISKKAHRYGTRMMQAGDTYQATGESDARLMVALGFAERAPKEVPVVVAPAPKRARKVAAPDPVETPFEKTVPLTPADVVESPALAESVAPAPRRRISLRSLADSLSPKADE